MATRRPLVGGNWKMNLHTNEARALASALVSDLSPALQKADVILFPAFPYLPTVNDVLRSSGSSILLGAQDCYPAANGAFTGEVSLSMLKDVGCSVVLVGHSERRHVLGESDVFINAKVRAALAAEMQVMLCVGEKIEQREAGQTDAINAAQVCYGLAGVTAEQMARVSIAYEPVWAIGTGKTATAADAQAAHVAIRRVLAGMFGEAIAQSTLILYGGSVKPDNAAELCAQPDIDGGLIGGASLKAADFAAIVNAAAGI